jgi:hypothetical protein
LKREIEPYAAPTNTTSALPTIGAGGQLTLPGTIAVQPTLYRYTVLIERAKQLVQLAGQIEASMLSALEKRDQKAYDLLKARQDLGLAQAGVQLQQFRVQEAKDGATLAGLQQTRAKIQAEQYQQLLANEDIQKMEQDALNLMDNAAKDYADASTLVAAGAEIQGIAQGVAAGIQGGPGGAITGGILGGVLAAPGALASLRSFEASKESTRASRLSMQANIEIRRKEWELQQAVANQDVAIGGEQITIANDHVQVVTQESVIAGIQVTNAKDTIEFLTVKEFTSADLYDWMSGILEGVYRFFLRQATSMAKVAENQLAFERQEIPPSFIQADYWQLGTNPGITNATSSTAPDRRGLTGSARLLQDIYQLDQYAFDTDKRKLQLIKTISLARLAPAEFQRFRETGVMSFATPSEMFDRDFPGHYLRFIKRVRMSIVALIPPNQGIRAELFSTSISRVVLGGDVFQIIPIRRDPQYVAFSSPINSAGLFELDPQADMLLPFEGNGVDASWELSMPKAANLFDYDSIADVLITFEYTALNSLDYRQQVIQTLSPSISADRPYSFRNELADQWYDLHNPDQTSTPMTVRFTTAREQFPPNIVDVRIQQVLLYFARANGQSFEVPVTSLRFKENGAVGSIGGGATSIDGVISTRRGNAGSWTAMIGKTPFGDWELVLPKEMKDRFNNEDITDILFVITYSGRTPEWPN